MLVPPMLYNKIKRFHFILKICLEAETSLGPSRITLHFPKTKQNKNTDNFFFFIFREKWEKVNVKFNPNGTISYQQKKTFVFDPDQSVGSEDDMVVIPNIPMLVSKQKKIV